MRAVSRQLSAFSKRQQNPAVSGAMDGEANETKRMCRFPANTISSDNLKQKPDSKKMPDLDFPIGQNLKRSDDSIQSTPHSSTDNPARSAEPPCSRP